MERVTVVRPRLVFPTSSIVVVYRSSFLVAVVVIGGGGGNSAGVGLVVQRVLSCWCPGGSERS